MVGDDGRTKEFFVPIGVLVQMEDTRLGVVRTAIGFHRVIEHTGVGAFVDLQQHLCILV